MIMKRGFLLAILLCWPFVSMADEPAATTDPITTAITEYETNYSNINTTGVSTETKRQAEKTRDDAIAKAKEQPQCDVTDAKGSKDGRSEDDKKKALEDAKKKYEEAKATEQSLENRTLTALSTAATGIGGMELARGLAEQSADKAADQSMAAYIATMRCTYGEGKQVKAGPDEIELPGGNSQELMNLRAEYFALAADLKERKEALGMQPGIESEEILDKAATGLYDDENVGITSSAYASLYRAQMMGSEEDQAKIDDERKASKNRVIAGAVVGGVGVVGSMVGNSLINGKLGEKIKEGIANKKVGQETQKLLKAEADALKDIQKCLKSAGVTDAEKLSFSEFYPSVLSFKSVKCDASLIAAGSENVVAKELIYDSIDEATIYNHLTVAFGPENTGKMIGYTLPTTPSPDQITGAKTKIKTSIESIQKKFKEAEEKDKASAEKAGISIGNITGSSQGGGLSAMSSLFNGFDASSDGSSSGFDLSSFIK